MKVTLFNEHHIRESVPIELAIAGAKGEPRVSVHGLGDVDVKLRGDKYIARFWTMEQGHYEIKVQDLEQTWQKVLIVKEQEYLGFAQEFSFFLVCLTLSALGVALWIKKLKGTKP